MDDKQIADAIADLLAGSTKDYSDPGEAGYCAQQENNVRGLMELTAFYDESGPRSDPSGDYLCGTCQLRKAPGGCLYVDGAINMSTGSCQIYVIGTALPVAFELRGKFTQEEAGYAERPEAKGFGCRRCEYVAVAKDPDADARKMWCSAWGVHVRKNACCARHDGNDMILPWQAL